MKIDTVDTLLLEEIKDLYDVEKRLTRALPKIAKGAASDELRSAINEHLDVTRGQVQRLEQVFELLDSPAKAKTCTGMKGIIEEGEETLSQDGEDSLLDLAIIGAARRVEHYEMAGYKTAQALAEQAGNSEVAELLQQTLDEEREADEKLSSLASQFLSQVGGTEQSHGQGNGAETNGRTPARKTAKKHTARVSPAQS